MALQAWDKNYREQLKIQQQEIESLQQQLMISGGGGGNRPGEDGPYRPPNPDEVPGVPPGYPHIPKLLAHVNEDGTAHDWRAPGHGGLRVPGGEVNPHGRRGTNTWDDGRQRYTPEELKQIEDYMKSLEISQVNYGKPTKLDNYFKEVGYPNRDQPDWLRLKIMRGAPKA